MKELAPDGGYGWVVVFGACLTNIFNQSLVSVFGLLFGDRITELGGGASGVALVMNVASLFLNFSGLITGPLLKTCTPRSITITGSVFVAFGLMASALVFRVWHLLISYSFCVGFGLGLIVPSSFMAVNEYFTTKKGRAVGVSVAGTGLGQMVMPHVVRVLLEQFGFNTTVLVMGLLALNGVIGGWLFRPLVQRVDVEAVASCSKDENANASKPLKERPPGVFQLLRKAIGVVVEKMDLKLFKEYPFVSLTIGLALAYTCSTNFSMIYPLMLQNEINMTKSETAVSMSLLAGSDLVSRLALPFLTDNVHASNRDVFLLGIMLLVVARSVLALVTDKVIVMIVSVFFGLVRAATVINQNLTISEYCIQRPHLLPAALGINMTMKGLLVITVGQVLGSVGDYYNSYDAILWAQCIIMSFVAVVWIPEVLYQWVIDRRRSQYHEFRS